MVSILSGELPFDSGLGLIAAAGVVGRIGVKPSQVVRECKIQKIRC